MAVVSLFPSIRQPVLKHLGYDFDGLAGLDAVALLAAILTAGFWGQNVEKG